MNDDALPARGPRRGERGDRPDRVIDSFLVVDGHIACLDLHIERTVDSLDDAFGDRFVVPSVDEVKRLYTDGLAKVPRAGAWFPLIEARVIAETQVVLAFNARRPAPPRRNETRLALAPDRRKFPRLKGADPDITEADRAMARDLGDDDALYLDASGHVLEAANGAVIGWTGNTMVTTLVRDVLESTTLNAMLDQILRWRASTPNLKRDQYDLTVFETDVTLAMFRPDEVDELWYLNALHGMTPVVALDGKERHYDRRRFHAWREVAGSWWVPV